MKVTDFPGSLADKVVRRAQQAGAKTPALFMHTRADAVGAIMRFSPEAPLLLGARMMRALRATGILDDQELAKRVRETRPIPRVGK